MNRTSLVIALIVPSLLVACGAGENYVGTEWADAGDAQTSNTSDSCSHCSADTAKLVLSDPETCLSAPVGQPSGTWTFDIANEGTATSGALNVSLSGFNVPSFAITSDTCTGATLATGAKCSVAVLYAPASAHANAESANLTVADTQTSVEALIRGSDIGTVTASPAALSFGEVAAGSTSPEVLVRVTTTSFCETTWTATIDNPNFVISSNTCIGHITGTCEIGVRLAPASGAATSSISGQLTMTASDSGTATVALIGVIMGTAPPTGRLAASPTALDFGEVIVGQSVTGTLAVTLANAKTTASLTGPGAAQFSIAANTCTTPGTTCTMQINFAPVTAGTSNATLNISDGQSTVTVSLVGKGLAISVAPPFAVSPAALDFGQVAVGLSSGPMIVTVTTPSARAFTVTLSGSAATEVSIVEETCTVQIPAGGTCTIKLQYSPTKVSTLNGVLTVSDGADVAAVTLAGVGWTLI